MKQTETQTYSKAKSRTLTHLVMLVLLVVVLGVATYAWFYHSVEDDGTGSDLTSSQWGVYATNDYKAYKYSADDKKGVAVAWDSITLSGYDVIFETRNENTAIILRIPITGTVVSAGKSFKVKLTCDNEVYLKDGVVDSKICNAAVFKCACIPAVDTRVDNGEYTGYEDLDDMIYNEARKYIDDPDHTDVLTGKFVSGATKSSYSSATKSDEVAFTIPTGYTVDSGTLYLYIEVDYDDDLSGAYSESHLSQMKIADTDMSLANDLETISFSGTE